MNLDKKALEVHRKHKGKIELASKLKLKKALDLSIVYTPGVAAPCREIQANPEKVYEYTAKGNFVAVVTDGSAVLGLGDIGPEAALPVMEGKAILFKELAGVDAFPICLATRDVKKIVETIRIISPVFGGINLEDISAPRCFLIEKELKEILDIPVFHDDQHGTAVVVLSALINALKLVKKDLPRIKIVVNGAGSAGIAVSRLLVDFGAGEVILADTKGAIFKGRSENMNFAKEEIASCTNPRNLKGDLKEIIRDADVFIGLSVAGALTPEMVKSMAPAGIVLAMANPVPEIEPTLARSQGARIVGTGRSDYPNQINNCLGFPGIFKGALRVRASEITEGMKIAAAKTIAGVIDNRNLREDYIIPSPLDPRVVKSVASNVSEAAIAGGVARLI